MSPRRSSLFALAIAVTSVAAPLRAQGAASTFEAAGAAAPASLAPAVPQQHPSSSVPAPRSGPTLAAAPSALQLTRTTSASVAQEEAALRAQSRGGFSQSQVLMIVGGVALITGLVIGDDAGDVLAIGGAGVGLFGLYRYLQGR